eukprot:c21983_g4_i1.p1 GENE.c21983_g4_i1~~c21983_g4_i1.p1  ORF type:complete len:509 (-),score=261.38 c21983_g4_i1:206-1621(-)
MSSNTSLIFQSEPEFSATVYNKNVESFMCVATIQAPEYIPDESQKRAGIDVVAVLDRSGSMAGGKMEMLHQTVKLMIDNLKEIDRLSIVSYDDKSEIVLPLTKMTSDGKTRANTALATVTARGGTDLTAGVIKGFDVIDSRGSDKNDVASVLLMTDGLANQGITGVDSIVAATTERLKKIKAPTSLYTFGFGADHDGTLLSKMAQASGTGTYYFMKSVDSIPQAFADCLGGLLSVFAQNISLTITSGHGDNQSSDSKIKINSITTSFTKTTVQEGKKYSIEVGDIFSEEQRDILIDISFPAIQKPTEQYELLDVQVKYFSVVTSQTQTIKGSILIERTQDEPNNPKISLKVDEQRNRVKTAKAMEDAQKLGDTGKIEEARGLLENCKISISQSRSAAAPTSSGLVADLDLCAQQMRNKNEYEAFGSKNLSSHARQHWVQRGAASSETEQANYSTKSKAANMSSWMGKMSGK